MVISENIRTIIWDWNGTLLDDIDLCISAINRLLTKRNLALLDTVKYREVFSFPVINYYEEVGFNFAREPFEIPAQEFIDIYNREVFNCGLHHGAKQALEHFRIEKKRQIVLSAMEQTALETTLHHHQIGGYFDEISGLDNHYAVSKLENGKALIKRWKLNPDEICLIGDTIHDFEVAQSLGCQCILIADGHQSEERLLSTGSAVLKQLVDLVSL